MLPTYTTTQSELLVDLQNLLGTLLANLTYWEEKVIIAHAQLSRVLQERSSGSG